MQSPRLVAADGQRPGEKQGGWLSERFPGHGTLGKGHRLIRVTKGECRLRPALESVEEGPMQSVARLLRPILVHVLGQRLPRPQLDSRPELAQGSPGAPRGQMLLARVHRCQEDLGVHHVAVAGGEGIPTGAGLDHSGIAERRAGPLHEHA
jgi:hypothetical protein